MLLAPVWQNRALARILLSGRALRVMRPSLVDEVEANPARHGHHGPLPRRLAAHGLANGLLSPILAWLAGELPCEADEVAAALVSASGTPRVAISGSTS